MGKNSLLGLRRGLKLLELLAASDGLTFNQVKNAFDDLVPSTVSRLLKVLTDEGMIRLDHNTKRYLLAERSQKMADLISGGKSIAEKMQPYLDRLAGETGLSAAFVQFENNQVIIAAKSEQPEAFHYSKVGSSPNSLQHAMKRLCFAYSDQTPPEGMDQELLKEIKKLTVYINQQDDQVGLTRIAAPVFGETGEFLGALGISFYQQLNKLELAKVAEIVKQTGENAGLRFLL